MSSIEGVKAVIEKLRKKREAHKDGRVSVVVGYTQQYAIYVHENLTAHHPVGQAKYLEQPFRMMQDEIAEIVADLLKQGKTMEQALLVAGLRLQRESQLLCPVDTGALKASAFTRSDKGG